MTSLSSVLGFLPFLQVPALALISIRASFQHNLPSASRIVNYFFLVELFHVLEHGTGAMPAKLAP